MNGALYRQAIQSIKSDMQSGRISYDQARALAEPILADMNKQAADIAKKFGKKPTKFTFGYVMR